MKKEWKTEGRKDKERAKTQVEGDLSGVWRSEEVETSGRRTGGKGEVEWSEVECSVKKEGRQEDKEGKVKKRKDIYVRDGES